MPRQLGFTLALAIAILGLASIARAGELAIVGATVYPSPDAAPIANATVLTRDGRIERVGPASETPVPAGATVIDGTGGTVVAGFWNSHVHLIVPDLLESASKPPSILEAALQRMLTRWGFTAAFDIASVPGNGVALRERIERGELRGPLLLTVDAPFYPRDGTPIYVRKLYQDPSDVRGIEIAMTAGVDVLAHTTPVAGPWPAELVDRIKARRMALIPTLSCSSRSWRKEALPMLCASVSPATPRSSSRPTPTPAGRSCSAPMSASSRIPTPRESCG